MGNSRSGYKQQRTATDGRYDVTCPDCGLILKARGMSLHRVGAFHLHHARIKALLNVPCVTLAEIGQRLGVTRERARQIARDLEYQARERSDVCSLRRTFQAVDEVLALPILIALKTACDRVGVDFSTVSTAKSASSRVVRLNGLRCAVLKAHMRGGHGENVVNIRRPRGARGMSFLAYWISARDRWLIVPAGSAPAASTMFSLNEPDSGKPGPTSARKDWRSYLDAWHLLKEEE